jgi:ABC-2 type transport system permease protein
MQEMVFLYPGQVDKAAETSYTFTPLLKSGALSGSFPYFQVVQRSFLGVQLNRNLPHRADGRDYILAAQIQSGDSESSATDDEDPESSNEENGQEAESPSSGVNLIVIADLDFISQQFFDIRRMGVGNLNFDNVTFFLNCIDVLAKDESFIALRNRRVRHRTLERVEAQTRSFIERRTSEEAEAEQDAEQALQDAQRRLDERVQEVQNRPDLDAQTKQIMSRNLQEVENRRFEVLKSNIESEKEAKIAASKENMEAQIRQIQSGIRTFAVLLPPIPVFILGVWIFVRRQERAREGARAARRLRG